MAVSVGTTFSNGSEYKHEPSTILRVHCNFTKPLLGTASSDPELHSKYIASNAPDAPGRKERIKEEVEAIGLDETIEKGMTVFPRDPDGNPCLWDYQIRGFFKSACGFLRNDKDTESHKGSKSSKLTSYKKKIDGMIFVYPRCIPLELPAGASIGDLQRPLRAQTAQGERVALAHSEEAPAGTSITFWIEIYDPAHVPLVIEWLEYGVYNGLGQWRNSGMGSFEYLAEVVEAVGK